MIWAAAAVAGVERQVPRHLRDFWRSHPIGISESPPASPAPRTCTARDPAHRLGEPDHRPRQLGILERERGGSITAAVTWHVRALAIRLRLGVGVPEAVIDLRHLAALRQELGAGRFTSLLTQAADSTGLADTITSLLDQVDGGTA